MTAETHTHRLGTVDETGQGTPASTWSAWRRPFDELDLSGWERVLVVAPHPDDEVLGVGALMAALVARAADVTVVAVTDGGAAYPLSPTLTPAALARVRVRESDAACAALGVAPPHRLELPDSAVARHERELVEHLTVLLRPGTICLATWSGDGHPDHEAVGRAAAQACRDTGAVLVEYPVWMWHWSSPGDEAVPWHRARAVSLSDEQLARKRRAVGHFVSQTQALSDHPADAAVLPPFVIDRLVRDREVVLL